MWPRGVLQWQPYQARMLARYYGSCGWGVWFGRSLVCMCACYRAFCEWPSTAPFPRPGAQPVACRACELIALSGFVRHGTEAAGRPWHKQGISTAHAIWRGHAHEEGRRWDPPMPLQRRTCPPRALIRRGLAFPGPGSAREVQAAGLELRFHGTHDMRGPSAMPDFPAVAAIAARKHWGLEWPPLENCTLP